MKLVTTEQMRAIEREADAKGLTYALMMEYAGTGLADVVDEEFAHLKGAGVVGLVGSGNNGGDTLVALSRLAAKGWKTAAYIVRARPVDDSLQQRLIKEGGIITSVDEDPDFEKLSVLLSNIGVILDGILGTGTKLPLHSEVVDVLRKTKEVLSYTKNPPPVVAVDCPSGVDTETGESDSACLPATLTVTMAAVKKGLLCFPANKLVGELRIVSIGIDEQGLDLDTWREVHRIVADNNIVKSLLPTRPVDAHKGTFGTVLIVAGSINYTGAALLAGEAAYRVGAGLVTLAVPAPLHQVLAGQLPEATWLLLPHELGVIHSKAANIIMENLERVTALLIGPGLGLENTTKDFLACLISANSSAQKGRIGFTSTIQARNKPVKARLPALVIDADGLKLLDGIPSWNSLLPTLTILTPHPGEMAILTKLSVGEIQANRLEITEEYAKKWGHVVVLKGANTVIAEPGGRSAVIPVATSALARAGTGDVLAGLIVGLRTQGLEAFEAALTGSWIHAQAGLQAAETLGCTAVVLAGDVLDSTVAVISQLYN